DQRQVALDLVLREILNADPAVSRIATQEEIAPDEQIVLVQDQRAALVEIRIRQLHGEHRIIFPDMGAEKKRRDAVYEQLKSGDITGVAVEKPVGAAREQADVAMRIQDGE